jgi:hypothetical protein
MASIIDPQLATSLIQEYQAQNSTAAGPAMMTPDGKFLNGFFIDRQSLEAILNNPNFVGISLYLAKDPNNVGSKENIFTIVFAGAEPNPNWVQGSTTATPYLNTGDPYDNLFPCPPYCGSLGQ